jgi:putative ABC transport system ATP-binding protein
MPADPMIICENLVKIYKMADMEVVALQGLDLVVGRGEFLGIVGASGSGKSTLMNILGGLDRPSAGRVWVNGQDLLKLSDLKLDHYRRNQVGFVWQHASRNLVSYLNALENVELPMTLAGITESEKRSRATQLLNTVGLSNRAYHSLGQLSGGEQQRVAIAVALTNQPALLLADEPTGEVDSATAEQLFQIFRDLNINLGLTILIVSHDPALVLRVDRVVAIRDGKTATETIRQKIAPIESCSEVLSQDKFEELAVLDSAGRLQIPKDLLQTYKIKGRARLEEAEMGILIRSVPVEAAYSLTSSPDRDMKRARRKNAGLTKIYQCLKFKISRKD